MFEKKLSGLVQKWTTRYFCASGNFQQAAFHQGLQHAVDIYTANGFDVRPGNRLAVSDYGEGFQCRRAQARRLWPGKQLADPAGTSRICDELPTFRLFNQVKGPFVLNVIDLKLLQCTRDLGVANFGKLVRLKIIFGAGTSNRRSDLSDLQRLLSAEQK